MSLRPPPKMLSRLRDEEGRAYHDATMQKRRADAMWIARLKEMARIAKMRGGMAEPRLGPDTSATNTVPSFRLEIRTMPTIAGVFTVAK